MGAVLGMHTQRRSGVDMVIEQSEEIQYYLLSVNGTPCYYVIRKGEELRLKWTPFGVFEADKGTAP